MKVISNEVVTKKGINKDGEEYEMGKYERITYDNGSVVENIVGSDEPFIPSIEELPEVQLSDEEKAILSIQQNTEYLVCLSEIKDS